MEIDFSELEPSRRYAMMIRMITPRPIAWISTVNPDGQTNLAPFSFFSGVGSNPPAIVVSFAAKPGGVPKDTLRNIELTEEFVVNVVPFELRESMYESSKDWPSDKSEFEITGLSTSPSRVVRPPRVQRSPIQMECRLHQLVPIGSSTAVFGIIHWVHIDDEVLDAEMKIDPARVDSIGRMGGMGYSRTTDRFELK